MRDPTHPPPDAVNPPANALPRTCDVLVAGGGPAGSTAAALLAARGFSVVLCEKERHPRFHIGESLLPMNMPIFERLGPGLRAAVEAIGVRKQGADFPAPDGAAPGYLTFDFRRALNRTPAYSVHVRRDQFDALLFDHARACGAQAFEATRVEALAFDADGVAATLAAADGTPRVLRARYLVDASGRDTLVGNRLRLKRRDPRHQSAALFGHYEGVARRPGADAGNISIYRFAHGWVWMIPLPDGRMSVGAVCTPAYLRQRQGDNAGFLQRTLDAIPDAAARMRGAHLAGNLHATGNYSYACTRAAGPRWILAGDAYAFLDPIFSSGVFLAMHGAERAAAVVAGALAEPAREAALQRAYARELRRGLGTFAWFITRFTSPALRHLFARPRNHWQLEQALISMLAGDVHGGPVRRRLALFKAIHALTALRLLPAQARDWWQRRREAGVAFAGGTTGQDHV